MKVRSSMPALTGAVLFVVVAALSACTVVVEDGPVDAGPGPLCTREYAPVCARRGGDRQTFANACEADAAGYLIVRRGECVRDEGPRFCTREYAPVCARRGGSVRTFPNSCEADAAGYRIFSGGPCRRFDDEDRICAKVYAPVCARRGGVLRTFPNSCEADVAGYRIVDDGPC